MNSEYENPRTAGTTESEQLMELDAALQRLRAADRDILIARFFQGRNIHDIAKQYKASDAAVEKRISRAIDRLRNIMSHNAINAGRMNGSAVAALLIAGRTAAPAALIQKVLHVAGGGVPVPPQIAHAARNLSLRMACVPVAAAVAFTVVAGAVVIPAIQQPRPAPGHNPPAAAAQAPAITSPGAESGVLTCVAYDLLAQRDLARAVEADGKLISGKPNGVRAYNISADLVRTLAWSQVKSHAVVPWPQLQWLPGPSYPALHYGINARPIIFAGSSHLSKTNPQAWLSTNLEFQGLARPYTDFMSVRLKFDANSQFTASIARKSVDVPCVYSGKLNIRPGHAVVLLRYICTVENKRWYNATILDVQRYLPKLLPALGAMHSSWRYLRQGPPGLTTIATDSVDWNTYAEAHLAPSSRGMRWSRTLPGGAQVGLAAITSRTWPLCPWTPNGRPLPALSQSLPLLKYLGVNTPRWAYEYTDDGDVFGRLGPLAHYFSGSAQNAGLLELRLPGKPKWTGMIWDNDVARGDLLRVGVDSGVWKVVATAAYSPHQKRLFSYFGRQFTFSFIAPMRRLMPAKIPASISVGFSPVPYMLELPDQVIAIGAVDRRGRLVTPVPGAPGDSCGRLQTSRQSAIREYADENIPISIHDVRKFVWIVRPRHWIVFRGFALKPSLSPDRIRQIVQQNGAVR